MTTLRPSSWHLRPRVRLRRRDGESGQALIVFVGGLTTVVAMNGLVVDGGIAFVNRREAQNTADLAALAATRVIADHYRGTAKSGSDVYAALASNSGRNGCVGDGDTPCSWTARYIRQSGSTEQDLGPVQLGGSIPSGAQGVAVSVERNPDTFFLSLVGRERWDIGAQSAGLTARVTGLPPGQVLPIGVDPPNTNFQAGSVYQLTAGKDAPGNFSFLSWTGSNDAGNLAESLCNPNNPAISFPAWISGDPGKSNSHEHADQPGVRKCIDKWIDNKATVLIPLWREIRGQGNSVEYEITGLAAFVLLDRGQPAIDSLVARFVEYYPLPTVPGNYGGPPCEPGSGGCEDQVTFVGVLR